MTAVNRRRFLQLTGGTAAASMLSTSIARAAAIQANRRTGTLKDVEHVVVLMQENRSFDHYFGAMRGVRGFGDPRPATLPNGKPIWHQADGAGNEYLPFHPEVPDLGLKFLDGLDHSWNGGHKAWNNGKHDQWIPAKGPGTMGHFNRADIPFHYALADAFTICDAYHCSLMTSTDPNRYYLWTGYTGNDGAGGGPVLSNAEAGYDWKTYPERLEAAGVSWKIYQDVGDGLDRRRLHRQLRRHLGALLPPVPERRARRPAVRQSAHRHERQGRPGLLRRPEGRRRRRDAAPGLLDRGA
jgi:phospholipase C